jgi:O-acetyl-ADP-ribose deacetylase (regulator of RNase III)/catechol 2,3-dioxygenase-like lactoylglutathione lyase family enzyme
VPIEFVAGDLFANEHEVEAFAQGCNCQGSMGAGIAKGFRDRYAAMYEEYRARCQAEPRQFNLGDVWLWKADEQPWVFNLGTQEKFWHARASYEAIETALGRMRALADAEHVTSIALPRIGVGYGGLSWKKVRAIVERILGDWPGRLVVYEEFVPSADAARSATDPAVASARPSESPARDPAPARRGARRNRSRPARRIRFGFKALTIACTDHRKSERFYREILGAVPLATDDPGYGCLWIKLGRLTISLMPNAAEPSPASFPTHAMPILWLETADLKAAAERFAAEGVTIISPSDGQFLQIADPDGLVIEVWQKEPE